LGRLSNVYLTDDELVELVADRIKTKGSSRGVEVESILADIERLNMKLAKSEEHRSRFLSIVRNSFHNPLFGMITLVDSIKRELKEDSAISEKVDMLNMELQFLNYQINNVVAASEIEASQLEMNLSEFSVKALFADIDNSLQFLKERSGSSIKISSEVDDIVQDREKLQAILVNLLSNALTLNTEKEKPVRVSIFSDENLIAIDIINSGEMELSKDGIYTAFKESRGDHYNRDSQGLGIGLTIVKAYIEFLGGEINFDVEDGETRFRIIIDSFEKSSEEDDTLSFDLDFGFDFDEEEFDLDGKTI
jgi:light-regulated signal transduction histidine kinase (bacteriophytochrome)